MTIRLFLALVLLAFPLAAENYDVILRGGTIYDGSGSKPYVGDVAIKGDRIAKLGDLGKATAKSEIDVKGLAVALEVMGEGWSMGPLNEAMKKESVEQQGDIKYDITWTTLGEYLEQLEKRGTSL